MKHGVKCNGPGFARHGEEDDRLRPFSTLVARRPKWRPETTLLHQTTWRLREKRATFENTPRILRRRQPQTVVMSALSLVISQSSRRVVVVSQYRDFWNFVASRNSGANSTSFGTRGLTNGLVFQAHPHSMGPKIEDFWNRESSLPARVPQFQNRSRSRRPDRKELASKADQAELDPRAVAVVFRIEQLVELVVVLRLGRRHLIDVLRRDHRGSSCAATPGAGRSPASHSPAPARDSTLEQLADAVFKHGRGLDC